MGKCQGGFRFMSNLNSEVRRKLVVMSLGHCVIYKGLEKATKGNDGFAQGRGIRRKAFSR